MRFVANDYDYRRRLPHYQKFDRVLFVTFRKLMRPEFPPEARDAVLQHCLHDHGKRIEPHAAVVMPDHVHLLLTPLRDLSGWPYPLQEILKLIKGSSARSVINCWDAPAPFGRKSRWITCCVETRASKRSWIISVKIRCGGHW